MLKTLVSASFLQFLFLLLLSPVAARALCSAALEQSIERVIHQPHLQRTRWGFDIQELTVTGAIRSQYSRNGAQFFLPASTAKLFVTTALVSLFEPTYQVETPYFAEGEGARLKTLRIVGAGDPSILTPQLEDIARNLKGQGVQSIDTLVGDDRLFGEPRIIPSWEWVDLQTSDGVPITSLSFSQNSLPLQLSPGKVGQPLALDWLEGELSPPLIIENLSTTVPVDQPEYIRLERNLAGTILTIRGQLRVGASPDVSYVAIAHPTQYFLQRLQSALQSEGIAVKRLSVVSEGDLDQDPRDLRPGERKLGAIASPPLHDMLKTINQSSNNFYTESLLRHFASTQLASTQSVSTQSVSTTSEGQYGITPQASLDALKSTLEALGIEPSSYVLKDGSGLSRQNLVSPESLTATLKSVLKWKTRAGQSRKFITFKDSLAIAGQAGTLKRRFADTPVDGKFFGKTGTLSGTVTLAGILERKDRSTVVLSLMANHSDQPISVLRNVLDEIVVQVDQHQTCPAEQDEPMNS